VAALFVSVSFEQFFGGNGDDFAVAPKIEGQAFAGVFLNDFLDCGLQRQQTALGQGHFQNVCRWHCHSFPKAFIS